MTPQDAKAPTADPDDGMTRDRILTAATQCFLQLGITKTTMHDVARTAEMSRGTVYRYFPDRRALIDATVTRHAQRYYDEAADAMAMQANLVAQIGAFGEVFARTFTQHRYGTVVPDDLDIFRIMASDVDGALGRMCAFLHPYVCDAKQQGEIGTDVDVREASEMLARMLMSVTVMPVSVGFDVQQPATVRRYFEQYAVRGLLGSP
jgi:AcrR family transcriptional regulator